MRAVNKLFQKQSGIITVRSVTKTDTQSTTTINGAWVDISGLFIPYAPTLASNNILVRCSIQCANDISGGAPLNAVAIRLVRVVNSGGSIAIGVGGPSGSQLQATAAGIGSNADVGYLLAGEVLDTPNSTLSQIWKVQFCNISSSGTAYVNRGQSNNSANIFDARLASTLTIMEIAS